MRRAARKDGNHKEIVDALRHLGYQVAETHMVGAGFPDIVVLGPHRGQGYQPAIRLVEIKTDKGKLRPGQVAFKSEWEPFTLEARKPSDILINGFGWSDIEAEWVD